MICFTSKKTNVQCLLEYSFFLKKSRRLLTGNQYKNFCNTLKKTNNQQIVFVRAPKHFKTGKQRTIFFHSKFRKTLNFTLTKNVFFLFTQTNPYFLFNLVKSQTKNSNLVDVYLNKFTLTGECFFKISVWLGFYFIY